MITLATTHPKFSIDREILSMLTLKPTPLALMARDLGMHRDEEIRDAIKRLQKNGYKLHRERIKGVGDCVVASEITWYRVQRDSESYMRDCYG